MLFAVKTTKSPPTSVTVLLRTPLPGQSAFIMAGRILNDMYPWDYPIGLPTLKRTPKPLLEKSRGKHNFPWNLDTFTKTLKNKITGLVMGCAGFSFLACYLGKLGKV